MHRRRAGSSRALPECGISEYQTLSYEVDDGILTPWLDQPDRLNAFTLTMCEELIAAFARASADDDVRAVVVTGRGRAFCAGMNLRVEGNVFGLDETQQPTPRAHPGCFYDPAIVHGVQDTDGRVAGAILDSTKPVIAAVNGAAVGIGATMQCVMDARIASTSARIGFVADDWEANSSLQPWHSELRPHRARRKDAAA